jgi:hypothetical protein
MLIPLTYLTRMADLRTELFETTMVRWLPHANGSQRRLDALISGLFSSWMRGTSQAADQYRTLVPQAATGRMPVREQRALQTLTRVFGPEHQQQVAEAERPEPTIMRLLHALSDQLWTVAGTPLPDLPTTLLQGLLPLSIWGGRMIRRRRRSRRRRPGWCDSGRPAPRHARGVRFRRGHEPGSCGCIEKRLVLCGMDAALPR